MKKEKSEKPMSRHVFILVSREETLFLLIFPRKLLAILNVLTSNYYFRTKFW